MKIQRSLLIGLFLAACASPAWSPVSNCQEANSISPPAADHTYKAQRNFAVGLFKQNHRLEALPMFQKLAKQNPNDAEVIFGWGACLIDHSATLSDEQAGNRERVQARELLVRAKNLGNNSALLLNLLEMLPEDGSIRHDKNADVDQAIHDGEAAFAKNDYEAAIAGYSRAFALDPKNYSAALFIGDSYFAKKDFPNAATWYERAIQVDPTMETAYRYEAHMLTKNGDMAKARTRSIQAVVAAPYNGVTWRGLQWWANSNRLALTMVQLKQAGAVSQKDDQHINITIDGSKPASTAAVWMIYSMTRATWRTTEFKKHFPNEKQYRHTLQEESEALRAAATMIDSGDKKKARDTAADPDLTLLKRLYDAKMIEPYVLLSAPDRDIAGDYAEYCKQHRAQLEQYLSDFIVPPAPIRP